MANDKKFIAKNGIQGLDASVFTSITTSGKVGVGTASPVAGLDVLGTSGYTGTIHNHLYASGEGVRIFGKEATLDLLGEDNGDHASSVYFRNGTEGFAWINDPDSNSFQLRSFTSTGTDFNAHGTGSAVSNLVSILDIGKTGEVIVNGESQISSAKLSVYGNQGIATTRTGSSSFIKMLVGSGGESRIDTANASRVMEIPSSGSEVVFNNAGVDRDFRVESNGNSHILFVDGGNDRVAIGTNSPNADLHIKQGPDNRVMIESNGPTLVFKEINSTDQNWQIYHNSGDLHFNTLDDSFGSISTKMKITNSGNVGINTTSPNTLLTVLSKGATNGDNTRVLELKNNGTAFNADALASYNANTSYDVANGATLTYHSRGTAAGNLMAHVAGVNSEPVLTDRIIRAASQNINTAIYDRTYYAWDGAGTAAADMNTASTQLLETISAAGQTGSRYSLYANGNVYYAGSLTLGQADSASAHINSYENMTFNIDTDNDDTNRTFSWQTDGASNTGTKLMTLTDEGNLGIGTTDPGYKLDVVGNLRLQSATDVILDLNADTGNNSGEAYHPEVRFWQDGGVGSNLMLAIGSDNVGGAYTGTLANSAFIMGGSGHSGSIPLHFGVNNTVYATMESSGNLGIGITNPQDPLVVKSSGTMGGAATNANSFFTITDGSYSMYHDPNEIVSDISGSFHIAANNAAGELQFQTGGTTARMQIKSDGKVGIGTVTPSNVLHVHGADSGITVSSDASDRPHIRLVNGTTEMLRISANNTYAAIGTPTDAQHFMVFKNDFIGTNTQTAPNAQIHIGTATAEGTATNPALQIGGANTYRLGFYTEPELGIIDAANGDNGLAIHTKTIGEAVRIDADGQVGIGTNNPFSNLHINGNNSRLAFGAVTSNLAAQHRIEFWEGGVTSTAADSNYAIEYDGTATYGGDGALLFRGYGSAANQMYAGINRQGTTFLGMQGATPRVGIGTTNPLDKLDVRGAIRAGVNDGTGGSKVLRQRYGTGDDTIASMGTMYSSGAWLLGYGVDPKSGASGYVSSYDNFNGHRSAFEFNSTEVKFHHAPAQQTAVGSDITGLKTPFKFDIDDAKLTIYKESASATMLELHNYQSDIDGDGFNQGSFIDFKMTDNNATFTPQARIGMVIGESDGGDAGIPSEGSGNFQIYTGNGTDATGGGNLDLHSRFGQNGRLKIFTPGNTYDGTYYSTVTIDNSATNTWSRLRFDRSGTARWGLALSPDDKFRISNLYTNGSTADPDDNCFVIANNSNIGIGTDNPGYKLHIVSDLALRLHTATNGVGTKINFSDHAGGSYAQNGTLEYVHSDTVSFGTGNAFKFFGTEATMTLHVAGNIKATNDVTAYYSDPRLKDFHGNITGALDKVNSLGGYYFTENARAKELGYTNDRMQVGVNAAEVEEILPEVVTLAAIDDPANYKTVKYEKMVPLLIEAIKELTEQNMEMKQRLDKLEGEA